MQSSQLLPPPPAGPADVAASLPVGREPAPEGGEGSFGAVLESRMNAGAAADGVSGAAAEAMAASAAVPVPQAAGDAVLASLMASLAGAAGASPAPPAPLPVEGQRGEGEADAGLAAAGAAVPARVPLAEAVLRADRAPGSDAKALEADASGDAQPFARLLPAAAGSAPVLATALAVPIEAARVSPVADLAAPPVRAVPEGVPRADAMPALVVQGGDPPPEAVSAPRVPVPASFGSAGWNGAFADRVTWIAQARHPSAELTLNPPQLGPVEVRVSVSADQQATLSFHSPHAAVREAIQGSLPRLQEAFAASGLQLGDVLVGSGAAGFGREQGAPRDGNGESPRPGSGPPGMRPAAPAATVVSGIRNGSLGQVDLFA